MVTQSPKRELELNYPIDKIRDSIKQVSKLVGFNLLESNDTLGIYRVSIVKGISTAITNITVSKLDENRTKCVFEAFNTSGGTAAPARISELQDHFLSKFSEHLEGRLVVDEKNTAKGCMVFLPLIPMALFVVYETVKHL
jgi:hypothetical protein